MDTVTLVKLDEVDPETKPTSKSKEPERHVSEESSYYNCPEKKSKGKPIPGFAREVILKVASLCEEEAKHYVSKCPLKAPTKRAALYTGVSERTIQRIRNDDKKRKLNQRGKKHEDNKKYEIRKDHLDEDEASTIKRISKKGQMIPSSARDVISKVIEACDSEKKDGEYMVPFICKSKRTALYTGVSQRTVQRIKNEDEKRNKINEGKILNTPGRKRKRITFNEKIDDFDFHSIRRLIDDLILVKKVSPTCTSLHAAVKERIDFPFSEDTLHRLLHSKGFVWHRSLKGKRVLLEKSEIFKGRLDYLQRIKTYEEEGKFIIYLDEQWIGRSQENTCFDKGVFGVKGGICCSGRLVILNEFSAMGFTQRAEKLFRPNSDNPATKPDVSVVEKWMKENLFPNIPSNSVIVMSVNPYQMDDNIPKQNSTKLNLVQYLRKKRLKYSPVQTRLDLYEMIKKYLAKLPSECTEIDDIIESHGHIVLRLPPYMSEFNPIELAWADIKRYIRNKNPGCKLSTKLVKEITLQAIEYFQSDTLQRYVNHVIQMEEYFWDKQVLIQEHYDKVTNNSRVTSSSNDSNNIVSNTSDTRMLPNVTNTHASGNSILRDYLNNQNQITPCVSPDLPVNSVPANHSDISLTQNSYDESMLPHNQLGYVENMATRVLHKSTELCINQGMLQAGPSYLNL